MPIATHEFQFVSDLVRKQSGIVLEAGKEYLVEARMRPVLAAEGLRDISELVDRVKTGAGGLRQKVITAMTTNETSFFRDLSPFEALRTKILPDLMARRADRKTLNFWCAASSTGQEPYTVCMILSEMPELAGWKINFVATDLSPDCVARAKAGVFNQIEINRGLPAKLMVKYFKKQGLDWVVDDRLKRMVDFRQLNLIEPWPALGPVDLLFMRNVLIYFDRETKRNILTRTRDVLAPDGMLFLGGAETTLGIVDCYERVPMDGCGCYRLTGTGARHG